ncbi:hypothetical protein INR49_009962 [Caranx melampygus]|nr:hypothetical protein INR49_009962 [Caranx melampygus]
MKTHLSLCCWPGPTVSAVSLDVRSNLQQFFTGASVSLSCDQQTGGGRTGGRRVKKTREGQMDQCGSGFGVFDGLSQSDSGVYWCETSSGQRSLQVNISVTEGDLILEIPALPVTPGNDVTLRCRGRGMVIVEAYFFRGRTRIGSVPVRGMTLSAVQPSDEGLYSCSPDLLERSFISSFSSSSPPPPPPPPPPSCLTMLFAHLLAFCPFFVSTGLVLSIYLHRDMGDKGTVSMEMEKTETRSQDQKLRVRTQGCQLVSTGN